MKNNAWQRGMRRDKSPKCLLQMCHESTTRASFSKSVCAQPDREKEGGIGKLAVWMMFSRSSVQMNEAENPLSSWVLLLRALWYRTITERRMSPHYSPSHTHHFQLLQGIKYNHHQQQPTQRIEGIHRAEFHPTLTKHRELSSRDFTSTLASLALISPLPHHFFSELTPFMIKSWK